MRANNKGDSMKITSRRYTARDERASGPGVLGVKVFYVEHHKGMWGTGRSRKFVCDAADVRTAQLIARSLNKTECGQEKQ